MRTWLFLATAVVGCTSTEDDTSGPGGVEPREYADCDPISYEYCSLPYPSSFYLRDDPTTPTGVRVHLGPTTLPEDKRGNQPDPWAWNELDGFSPLGPILAHFPDLALDGVVGHDDIGASLEDGQTIVILDADTGERMPYFAELDVSGLVEPGKNFLMIRPAVPLRNGHRYVVGVRGLVDTTGAPIAASEGYAALRDGTPTDNWDIEGRREDYEAIYAVLEQDGWTRAETQLAWDFVVGSVEGITGRYTTMRDDMLARVGDTGPAYTITSIEDEWDENIYRRVRGVMTVPNYMEADEPGTVLTRDENLLPTYNGDTEVEFTILVPRTFFEDPRPLPIVEYGHGLLGSHDEVEGGYLKEMANRYGFVLFAVDWKGMAEEDYGAIALMIAQGLDRFAIVPERSLQGFVEFAAAARMMRGAMATDAAMAAPDMATPIYAVDPSQFYYYGNSQGGIYGGAYVTYQPEVQRAVLGVPGMPYSLLLARSVDFSDFFVLFQAEYPDQRDITMWMALMQNLWDRSDPGGTGRQMNEEPLDGVAHQILIQDAIGDWQVTTLGAHIMARAYGAALLQPANREIWGLDSVESGWTGSAIVEVESGQPEVPYENLPPSGGSDPHSVPRKAFALQEQLWTFLSTGVVEHTCDGPCDPE